ncbi:MFS transporter [Nocardioides terrae]|nr:MFS transporter [Nocardioides terrae]
MNVTPAATAVRRPGPLRHRNFRLLVTGASTSALGNAITPVALAFAVLDLGGSASDLGMVVAAFALAEVVTTLFGGVLGDRTSRRMMMSGSAAGSALVQAVVAGTLVADVATIPLLTVLGVVTGCLSALSQPSASAMTRMTVPADVLSRAIAMRSLLQTTASMVGFAVGGVLVAGIGPGWAIAVDAATFVVAAVCFAALRVEQAPATTGGTILAELREGFAEVRTRRWLWICILMALVYHLMFGGAQGVVGPIVVGEGIGRDAWGFALGAMMVGFVVGGLLCLRWHPRRGLFWGSVFLCLTPLFPLAMVSDRLSVILLGAFLHGFGLQVYDVQWNASIQEQVPDAKLSRVYSVDVAGSFVARPVGLALTGPLAEAVGFDRWLFLVAGVMLLAEIAPLLVRDVRRLERVATG